MKNSRFPEEETVGILREGKKPDRTVVEVSRCYWIPKHTYYRWRQRFGAIEARRSGG